MRGRLLVVFAVGLASGFAALVSAQADGQDRPALPAGPGPGVAPRDARCSEEYRVGSGDVLEVIVLGNEDLTRSVAVRPDGTISLALVGDLPVAGATPLEIGERLKDELARYLRSPQVDVQVREYNSRFVTIFGEVHQPGRRALRGCTRVIDALLQAGGFRDGASAEVVVSRVSEGAIAEEPLRTRIERGVFTPAARKVLETVLRDGDIVSVLSRAYVTVQGEVARPNRYQMDGPLTVTGAVTVAGGLTRSGSTRIKVVRVGADGRRQVLEADLKSIRDGRAEDFPLQPEDIVTVPRRFF